MVCNIQKIGSIKANRVQGTRTVEGFRRPNDLAIINKRFNIKHLDDANLVCAFVYEIIKEQLKTRIMKTDFGKEVKKYCDLYGYDVVVAMIKKSGLFDFVSFSKNSIPTVGSYCKAVKYLLDTPEQVNIEKCILHRSGDITIKTNLGYLKFWR